MALQVAKPVFTFPLQDYAARGHDLVLRGKLDRILKGDAWGACVLHAAGLLLQKFPFSMYVDFQCVHMVCLSATSNGLPDHADPQHAVVTPLLPSCCPAVRQPR